MNEYPRTDPRHVGTFDEDIEDASNVTLDGVDVNDNQNYLLVVYERERKRAAVSCLELTAFACSWDVGRRSSQSTTPTTPARQGVALSL